MESTCDPIQEEVRDRRDALHAMGAGLAGLVAVAAGTGKAAAAIPDSSKKKGVPRWGMVIDLRRCIGCRGCTVACKAEFDVPIGSFNCVVRQKEVGKYPKARKMFLPTLCNHCSGEPGKEPPCVDSCPNKAMKRARYTDANGKRHRYQIGATYQRPDGAVLLELQYCTGCEKCIEACPYKVRWRHPHIKAPLDKAKQAVGKCNLCMHRVEAGVLPACVNVCEGKARIFGDLNDSGSEIAKLVAHFGLESARDEATLLPGEKTTPNVFYIDPDSVISQVYEKGKEYTDEVF